jgi:hypothetical protein
MFFMPLQSEKKNSKESIKKIEKQKLPIAHKWVDVIKVGL